MVKITISNLKNLTLSANDNNKSIIGIIHENFVDWMHACGTKGKCTTCKMIINEGIENLTPPSEAEKRIEATGRLDTRNERLACQAYINSGHIIITVPDENKLPHLYYSS